MVQCRRDAASSSTTTSQPFKRPERDGLPGADRHRPAHFLAGPDDELESHAADNTRVLTYG